MRYYETVYIIDPNYEQERLTHVMQEVEREISKNTHIINHYVWGKKRLAYSIRNNKYGTYVLLQSETEDPSRFTDFERFMQLHKAVLRTQTVRLEKRPEEASSITGGDSGEPNSKTRVENGEADKFDEQSPVESKVSLGEVDDAVDSSTREDSVNKGKG